MQALPSRAWSCNSLIQGAKAVAEMATPHQIVVKEELKFLKETYGCSVEELQHMLEAGLLLSWNAMKCTIILFILLEQMCCICPRRLKPL